MTDAGTPRELLRGAIAGERRPLARLLTAIENDAPGVRELLPELFAAGRGAHLVGITGPPGSGKSTLVNALAAEWRRRGRRVGIIAVDPSSPYTGGSIMGDRIRMMEHAADPDVFMRSMAARGELGGLATTTWIAAAALDLAGYDPILVETVGAGQSEIEIARLAETTVVVEVPEMGDEIQAIKAGLLEVADVLVVNKGDRPGADRAARQLRAMLSTAGGRVRREPPPILVAAAATGAGVPELADAVEAHRDVARAPGAPAGTGGPPAAPRAVDPRDASGGGSRGLGRDGGRGRRAQGGPAHRCRAPARQLIHALGRLTGGVTINRRSVYQWPDRQRRATVMARTLDPTAHSLRRDEFVDATQRLMQAKGFDEISVQDLLTDLGASKGAFYHYFDSKAALLEAVVDRIVDGAMGSVEPMLADPQVPAVDKLTGLFAGITSWKNARRDLLLSLMRAWTRTRTPSSARSSGVRPPSGSARRWRWSSRRGVDEGTLTCASPAHAARVFVSLLMGLNEQAVQLYVARAAGEVPLDEIRRVFAAYVEGLERILGARPGSLGLIDDETLRLWFA